MKTGTFCSLIILILAFFRCGACNQTVNVDLDRGRIAEPTQCPRTACQRRDMMELIHNRSEFEDKQIVRLQETPGPTSQNLNGLQ
jgi:DNA replication licensing factor MCM4